MRFVKTIVLLFIGANLFGQGVIPNPGYRQFIDGSIQLKTAGFIYIEPEEGKGFSHVWEQNTKLLRSILPKYMAGKKVYSVQLNYIKADERLGAYKLKIDSKGIRISGDKQGVFYGIQSLRQLVFQSNGQLAYQTVEDTPAFKWRGMHLDVSRHFFKVDFIKKYIDLLALHKMNTFHWHLTDDQGWRIEIKKYPKLTEVGSHRKETIIDKNFDPYKGDGKPYSGFYTQEEIKEVVDYAKERYITVVPEIEMPGHAVAALSAYPQFSCREKPLEPLTKWGVSEDIYCSKDETFDFIFDILDEVLELFPSKYIHIGGDEAPKTRWKKCKHCQANIKKHRLKDEHELQSYFIGRIDSFLTSKGRKTIGWDEILEGGLAENAAVMSWRGEKGGIEAASQKHHVVMSPGSHCYFDHYQGDKKTEPLAIGGFTPLKKVHAYNPIPKKLNKKYHTYVLGAQGNVWTEYIKTPEHVMYMVLPRLCALSEVLWSGPGKNTYQDFTNRLIPHFNLLDTLTYQYSKSLFGIRAKSIIEKGNMFIALSTDFPELEIKYTTRGDLPDQKLYSYEKPIPVDRSLRLQAYTFKHKKPAGRMFSQDYTHHLALGKKVSLAKAPSRHFNNGGAQTLVDGIVGSLPWSGNEWLGWQGKTMQATIDLGKEKKVSQVKVSFLNAPESWIHLPQKVVLVAVKDKLESEEYLLKLNGSSYSATDLNITARDLKIKALPLDVIPEGNPGSGQTPWLFCSEIIIK